MRFVSDNILFTFDRRLSVFVADLCISCHSALARYWWLLDEHHRSVLGIHVLCVCACFLKANRYRRNRAAPPEIMWAVWIII